MSKPIEKPDPNPEYKVRELPGALYCRKCEVAKLTDPQDERLFRRISMRGRGQDPSVEQILKDLPGLTATQAKATLVCWFNWGWYDWGITLTKGWLTDWGRSVMQQPCTCEGMERFAKCRDLPRRLTWERVMGRMVECLELDPPPPPKEKKSSKKSSKKKRTPRTVQT